MSNECVEYCSWCLKKTKHKFLAHNKLTRDEYQCKKCLNYTHFCRMPNCTNMAKGKPQILREEGIWGQLKEKWSSEYCAEHDGSIASFKTLNIKISRLDKFHKIFQNSKVNMVKGGTYAATALLGAGTIAATMTSGGGAAALATIAGKAGLLGPAGTGIAIADLFGIALSNASLYAIGGSVATGVAVITAGGSALGGALGAYIAHAYIGEDKSFKFLHLHDSNNEKNIFINGFLVGNETEFDDWFATHHEFFPEEGGYGLSWGASSLKALGKMFASGVAGKLFSALLLKLSKSAAKRLLGALNPVLWISGVLNNPWHVSMARAEKTGILLAEAISRSKEKEFNLIGHSLGCRVIYFALIALSTKDSKKIKDVILLGGAVGNDDLKGWKQAKSSVSGAIYNCYSRNDQILKTLYKIANAYLSHPIGIAPIKGQIKGIKNINCTSFISGHTVWKENYDKVLHRIY